MAKKSVHPNKTAPLPGMTGPGVAPLEIPEITKAVVKYEKKKDARCQEAPGEIAAKRELQALLHKNSDKLPVNKDGHRFYQLDDVQYVLEETMKRRRAGGDDDESNGGE